MPSDAIREYQDSLMLGRHDADILTLKADVTEINQKLDRILAHMERQRGAKGILFGLLTLAGGLGAGTASLLTYFLPHH
jgi:hypothetical protein